MRFRKTFASLLAIAALCASGIALAQDRTAEEGVAFRQAQMKRIGSTFKAISDGLRQQAPDVATVQGNARTLAALARELPNWFPANTAPPAGLNNKAKSEIWSDAERFAALATAFQTNTQDLADAADVASLRAQLRTLAPLCARCHEAFANH